MLSLLLALFIRIFSNSYINVFQKILTTRGEFSSVINFYSYLGLFLLGLIAYPSLIFSTDVILSVFIMGLLGALGNYFIIKALSFGELSTLAPINSYKPIVALFWGILLLKEIPSFYEVFGIVLIILGTCFLKNSRLFYSKATLYRFLALFFSGTEAIFIKKVILLTSIESCFFYWALAGFLFSWIFVFIAKHSIRIKKSNLKNQLLLILLIALMQYSTNYVFAKMNVAYALALFQLSTILSVFLGVNVFHEKGLLKKLLASVVMLIGATILIFF